MKKWFMLIALMVAAATYTAAQKPNVKSTEIVMVDGQDFYLHTAVAGETLYSLSRLYGVDLKRIEFDNPQLKDGGLKAGQTIKIFCEERPGIKMSARKKARTFEEHTVAVGETTYSIARRYSVSINTLVQDNPGLDPANLKPGEVLSIRKAEIGETSPKKLMAEMDDYASALTDVSSGFTYHVVQMGETVYGLSRSYGVTPESIMANNDLKEGLKAGAMIKIPTFGEKAQGGQEPPEVTDPFATYRSPYDPNYVPDATTPPGFNLPDEYRYVQPDYSYAGYLDMAMLLPLSGKGVPATARNNFVEFYQGAMLALEDFKSLGFNIRMNLFDTERSAESISRIVRSPSFANTKLIIGPVYEEGLPSVMEFAYEHKVPIVSPLAAVNGGYGSLLYQMAPVPENRYGKLAGIFTADKNIIVITADSTDLDFEREMMSLIGNTPYQKAVYSKGQVTSGFINSILDDSSREAVFVVVAGTELGVDNILATISSVQNNRLARSKRTANIKVVGNSRWTRYGNVDRNLFFKLNVCYVANYHADRSSPVVKQFDTRYISAFGALPSLYSYRGYDAVKLFVGALTGDRFASFTQRLDAVPTPLQSRYEFRLNPLGNNSNTEWSLVSYGSDYTVNVK